LAAGGLSNNLGKKELVAIEIWDLVNKRQYSTIQDFHIEGIQYLEFNETGNRLLTIGLDPSKYFLINFFKSNSEFRGDL
jgi:hypothetical protein